MSASEAVTSAKEAATGLAQSPTVAEAVKTAAETAQNAVSAADPGAMPGAVDALSKADSIMSWGGYFQGLGFLFLLIALLWAALWFLKRKGGLKLLTMQGDLAVESRLTLSRKKSLLVVRFLNKRLLLGVTDHQITMLTELPIDEDDTDHTGPDTANAAAFAAHLEKASERPG